MGQIKHVCLPLKQLATSACGFQLWLHVTKVSVGLFKAIDALDLLQQSLTVWPRHQFLFSSATSLTNKQVGYAIRGKIHSQCYATAPCGNGNNRANCGHGRAFL